MRRRIGWAEVGRLLLLLFLVTGFMTSNVLLLLNGMDDAVTWTTIGPRWIITLLNVIGLTAAIWFIDLRRRKAMIDRPVQKIQEGIDRLTAGDFGARIDKKGVGGAYQYDHIIDGINKMAQELGSVETLKTDFVANVSHEMKTPLAIIKNYAELLQSETVSEEKRLEYATAIEDSAEKMTGLITNILRLSRIENQKIVPKLARFDLSRQLTDCILQFEDRWEAKELELDIDLEETVPIRSDADLLELVWNNLLSNAIKFTEPGGTVGVSLKAEGDYAVVTVRDTGCGISPEAARRIFDKFYQGDTSHATEGNGLGLALVRRVLDLLGGEIALVSEPGRGSAFTVKLRRDGNGQL